MNILLLIAGALAAFILIGHSTIGRKQFFLPMLAVSFDPPAKRIMEFVWHMSTASLVLPPLVLFYAGLNGLAAPHALPLVAFVAAQYALWGCVHLLVVSTSEIPGAVYKMFQWTLFLAVAGTTGSAVFAG